MDYLDPAKKRSHRIRLYIGYALLTIAVAIATVILVYIGNGFYVDRKTGEVIQNGQLFVNSNPDGASIYLNGKEQRAKTAGRLVVPSGIYNVTVKQKGYRDWVADQVTLDGGTVERLDYAFLLPKTLTSSEQQTFATTPYKITQSIDRQYLTLQFADHPLSIFIMDLTRPEDAPQEIVLPKTLFSDQTKIGQLLVSEWSDDDKHFMVKNMVGGSAVDFILVNREAPELNVNLTSNLNLAGNDIVLRDRAYNQYFAYNRATQTLGSITFNAKTLTPLLEDVIDFKPYGDDTILYVTAARASEGKVQARLQKGSKSYLMRELTVSPTNTYLLSIGKRGSAPVIAVGVASENKVTVIRDPLTYLKANPKQTVPLAVTVLQVPSPTEVSFSTDVSAVMARSGQTFASHNLDSDRSAKYVFGKAISATTPLQWADGKHLVAVSDSMGYLFDFNGGNVQQLQTTVDGLGTYFDNSYQSAYSFTAAQNGKVFTVHRSLLRVRN